MTAPGRHTAGIRPPAATPLTGAPPAATPLTGAPPVGTPLTATPVLGVLGGMGPAATADFLARLARLTPAGCVPRVHLTLTDDFPMAHAVVVISIEAAAGSANSA